MCPKASNSQKLSRCQSALCQNPLSRNYVQFRLRCTLLRSWRALHCLAFWITSAINLMFTNLHLREIRPPTLLFIFSTPSFSPLTNAIHTFVYSLLIFRWGGPQHSGSRVAAPRCTWSYHLLDQLFLVWSSAASQTGWDLLLEDA